ncbi:DUF1864 family protein [Streptomyces gardneri]|nr:DUF1864 family protein [Streptomyces gardneri]
MPFTRLPNQAGTVDCTVISALDPLHADEFCPSLPAMNASADVLALAARLRVLVPDMGLVASFSLEQALGAMRDLGLFLGSLKRHGVQPVEAVPEVEPVLVALGRRTDMIPRDTVHHYTEWNPTDGRQRMYTGDPQEGFLMNGPRMSMPHLGDAVDQCVRLAALEPDDAAFPALLASIAENIGCFDKAISMVVEKVTPEFFAREMRPYFEEVTVAEMTFLGPAAAHVPLFLVDLLVWASDHSALTYDDFIDEAAQHTLPQWRSLVDAWRRSPSVVTKVTQALQSVAPHEPPPALRDAAVALSMTLRALTLFRGKHLTIARKAYRDEIRLYELGSGNGSIELLRQILDLTRENAWLVARADGRGASGPTRLQGVANGGKDGSGG